MAHRRCTSHDRVIKNNERHPAICHGCKTAQLKSRSIKFTVQADRTQASFFIGQGHQIFTVSLKCSREAYQQRGTQSACAGSPLNKCLGRRLRSLSDLFRRVRKQRRAKRFARSGFEGLKLFHWIKK